VGIALFSALWGAAQAEYAVTVESNVVYATGAINAHTVPGTKSLRLDVYRPLGAPETERALILVHGGGFTSGNRLSPDMVDAAQYFAARGWVCFSIDYRLTGDDPPAPAPYSASLLLSAAHAAMVDTKRAVRWVRHRSQNYGCDTNRVAALGFSAGAYCILQAAISDESDYANDAGTSVPDQWPGHRGKVNAAVDVAGGCSNTLSEIDSLDAPLMIWHGDSDGTVPYSEAVAIHQHCVSNRVPHRFYTLPGVDHVPVWLATYQGRNLKQHAEEFLNLFFALRMSVASGAGAPRLSWPSVSNALYDVQSASNLMTSFGDLSAGVRATDDVFAVGISTADPIRFYRLRVRSGQP
jgi:acetyl esterase/lipase